MCVESSDFVNVVLDAVACCEDNGVTLKFNTRDMGNPMMSGPISRQRWMSEEAFIHEPDAECVSEFDETVVDEAVFFVEYFDYLSLVGD